MQGGLEKGEVKDIESAEEKPFEIHLKATDTEKEIIEKLNRVTDEDLLGLYKRNQESIHFLTAQRDRKSEAERDIDAGELGEQVALAYALVGILRKEIERRKMPLPPTMEEREL